MCWSGHCVWPGLGSLGPESNGNEHQSPEESEPLAPCRKWKPTAGTLPHGYKNKTTHAGDSTIGAGAEVAVREGQPCRQAEMSSVSREYHRSPSDASSRQDWDHSAPLMVPWCPPENCVLTSPISQGLSLQRPSTGSCRAPKAASKQSEEIL